MGGLGGLGGLRGFEGSGLEGEFEGLKVLGLSGFGGGGWCLKVLGVRFGFVGFRAGEFFRAWGFWGFQSPFAADRAWGFGV